MFFSLYNKFAVRGHSFVNFFEQTYYTLKVPCTVSFISKKVVKWCIYTKRSKG